MCSSSPARRWGRREACSIGPGQGGCRWKSVAPSAGRSIPGATCSAYRAITRLLRDFRPEVVHTHSAKGGILGRAAAWRQGVPAIVHTVHGAPFHPYQGRAAARWFFAACERWAARRCHALISVADAMTDLLVAADVAPREKFSTIYSGMEVEPLLQSRSPPRRHPPATGLWAGTRGHRQDRPAVPPEGPRVPDRGRSKRRPSASLWRGSCWSAMASCATGWSGRSAAAGHGRVLPVHWLGPAGATFPA